MTKNQLASCFLTQIKDDSIEGIFESLKEVSMISKNGGGIGIDITDIRSKGDYIKGTNGYSTGLNKMLCVFNATMNYVDQGGNKRKGALMVTLAIWHRDIIDFLYIRHESIVPELRSADLHHCVSIPDLFMKRVLEDGVWTTFSSKDAEVFLGKKLNEMYSNEFESAYIACETNLQNTKTFKARELFFEINKLQCTTGEPFIFFIDNANKKFNQMNLGTATTTNLCTEIIERTNGISVCNL
jgi:ribonucleoside-diphosphate reductase alpha chain